MDRIFLLDRSGSMNICRDDTIGGFNSFIESQKPFGGTMTLYQFDHEILLTYRKQNIDDVVPLTRETFVPRGGTALLDAIGEVIKKSSGTPTVIILTDGNENSSKTYTKPHIKDLIEAKEKEGWIFMYIGANQDAFAESQSMGFQASRTLSYDVCDTPVAFSCLSQALSNTDSQFVTQ
jgi:hypothetical protein